MLFWHQPHVIQSSHMKRGLGIENASWEVITDLAGNRQGQLGPLKPWRLRDKRLAPRPRHLRPTQSGLPATLNAWASKTSSRELGGFLFVTKLYKTNKKEKNVNKYHFKSFVTSALRCFKKNKRNPPRAEKTCQPRKNAPGQLKNYKPF
jgi:hypothetical protein